MTTPAGGIEPDPETLLPHAYLLAKLAMVMPLFEEARDALPAISMASAKLRHIDLTLGDRMDFAGTYSLDDWKRDFPERASTATASPQSRPKLKDISETDPTWVDPPFFLDEPSEHLIERSALQPEAPCEDPFDSRAFYELMQTYRMTPRHMAAEVVAAFEAVKDFARAAMKETP